MVAATLYAISIRLLPVAPIILLVAESRPLLHMLWAFCKTAPQSKRIQRTKKYAFDCALPLGTETSPRYSHGVLYIFSLYAHRSANSSIMVLEKMEANGGCPANL